MSRKVGEAVSVLEQDEAILCVLEFVGVVDVYRYFVLASAMLQSLKLRSPPV